MMQITRTSIISGVTRTMDIPVTLEQLYQWEVVGKNIQDVMPDLTADQREFIMNGVTAEEWDEIFGEEEDEYFDEDEAAF